MTKKVVVSHIVTGPDHEVIQIVDDETLRRAYKFQDAVAESIASECIRAKIDGWFARFEELVKQYRALGMTKDEADETATRVVRREIRAERQ